MKNKLLVGAVAVLSLFTLAGCKGKAKEDFKTQRKDAVIDTTLATSLKLVDIETGVKLDDTAKDSKNYYDIYVNSDVKGSLFTYSFDLTDYFASDAGERNKYMTISTLSFDGTTIYDSEITGIPKDIFVAEKGIAAKLGTTDFAVYTTADYTRTINTNAAYNEYKTNGTKVSLSIVYVPTLVVHNVDQQSALKANVLVPLYATFVSGDKEVTADGLKASTIASISSVNLDEYLMGTSQGKIKTTLSA